MTLPLFDAPPPRPVLPYARGSATSKDAAIQAQAFAAPQEAMVLAWFVGQGISGGTQKQASAALGIGRASVAARVNHLERIGQLRKTARRAEACAVYVATEAR